MRSLTAILLALAGGVATGAYLPNMIAGWRTQGADLHCLQASGSTICKGQSVAQIPWNWYKKLGGIVHIVCDFEQAGKAKASRYLLDIPSIAAGGCKTTRYIVSLSDGAVQTSFWIDSGRIVQIDRYAANKIDP